MHFSPNLSSGILLQNFRYTTLNKWHTKSTLWCTVCNFLFYFSCLFYDIRTMVRATSIIGARVNDEWNSGIASIILKILASLCFWRSANNKPLTAQCGYFAACSNGFTYAFLLNTTSAIFVYKTKFTVNVNILCCLTMNRAGRIELFTARVLCRVSYRVLRYLAEWASKSIYIYI